MTHTKEHGMTLGEHLEYLRVTAQKAAVATCDNTERAYVQGVADGVRNAILAIELYKQACIDWYADKYRKDDERGNE